MLYCLELNFRYRILFLFISWSFANGWFLSDWFRVSFWLRKETIKNRGRFSCGRNRIKLRDSSISCRRGNYFGIYRYVSCRELQGLSVDLHRRSRDFENALFMTHECELYRSFEYWHIFLICDRTR